MLSKREILVVTSHSYSKTVKWFEAKHYTTENIDITTMVSPPVDTIPDFAYSRQIREVGCCMAAIFVVLGVRKIWKFNPVDILQITQAGGWSTITYPCTRVLEHTPVPDIR